MNLLIILLGTVIVLCLLLGVWQCRPLLTDYFDQVEFEPTTDTEVVSSKVYEILVKNAEKKESYQDFLDDLKRDGIISPKIDMKFYLAARKARRSRLLTRDYILNRLS